MSKLKRGDGSWTLKGVLFILCLILGGLCTALGTIFQNSSNYEEKLEADNLRLVDSVESLKRYEKLNDEMESNIRKSNEIGAGLVKSLHELDSLQFKSTITNEGIAEQLALQGRLLDSANRLMVNQSKQLEDADRIMNPVYPFHLYVKFEISFGDPRIQGLIDSLNNIKKMLETKNKLAWSNVSVEYEEGDSNRVASFSVRNYQDILSFVSPEYPWPIPLEVGILSDTSGRQLNSPDMGNSIVAVKPRFNLSEQDEPNRRMLSRIKVYFKKRVVEISTYFTHFTPISMYWLEMRPYGIRDLAHSVVWVRFGGNTGTYRLTEFKFYLGPGFENPLTLNFDDTANTKMHFGQYLFHRISRLEYVNIEYGMDGYKEYFYDRGIESLSLPDSL